MGKEDKKRKGFLKFDPPGYIVSPKQKKSQRLLLDDDYNFDNQAARSEFDKLYLGQPSAFDGVDPEEEYCKIGKAHKEKHSKPKPKSLLDDGFGDEFTHYKEDIEVISASPPEPRRLVAQAVVRPVIPNATDDEEEVKNFALRIAEDFAQRENIVLVGGALYAYNGKFYYLMTDDEIQRKVFILYRKEVGQVSTVSVLRNVASLLKYCVIRKYDEFPVNSHVIIFENGTLDVSTGQFRKNSPNDLATSALSIDYDPSQKKMPWTKFFLETIANGDSDLYELMLQVIGYILSNDVKAKSFFYLEGVGDAGKSRFCDLIASFFPISGANKVARIALQDLGGKFALGNLVNAKLNISEDLPDSPLSPTTVSRIKMISDANRLEAEAKYVQPFSFRPQCKLLFASNHPLRLKEYDAAFVNRVVYIPFLRPIPKDKQDKYILEKMQQELPALFNHAFKAYRRLVSNGYCWAGAERFRPNISIASSGVSIDKELVLKQFVRECCKLDDYNATISTTDLQSAYNQFCHKHTYLPIQGDRFSRELLAVLPDTVIRIKIGNQKRGLKGIGLKASSKLSEFDCEDDEIE